MFTMNCQKHGHKFEPRYDEKPSGYELGQCRGLSAENIRKLLYHQVYLFDICTRCGDIRRRGRDD